jgi:hypothetical protein
MSWIGRATNTTFGTTSGYSGILSSLTLAGLTFKVFKTCERCKFAPTCLLGNDAVCDGMGLDSQGTRVYYALTSGQRFATSSLAQAYCTAGSLITPMRVENYESFIKDNSLNLNSQTRLFSPTTMKRNMCYEMAFTT